MNLFSICTKNAEIVDMVAPYTATENDAQYIKKVLQENISKI